jgi:hypothetical protein
MKKMILKTLLTSATLVLSIAATAQDNYTLKMNLKIEGLPPEYAAMGEQDIVTQLKGDKSKTEMTNMMGTNTTYYDGKVMTSLMDQMGKKTGFTATKDELNGSDKEKTEKPKIEYLDEKKMIAGYECSKAIVTMVDKDKKENKSTIWYTDKIKNHHPEAGKARGMDLSDLKGYPLSMEMSQSANGMDMKIIMTTTEVSTAPIDDAVFKVNTDGYQMMTYQEMKDQMGKQRQGGK